MAVIDAPARAPTVPPAAPETSYDLAAPSRTVVWLSAVIAALAGFAAAVGIFSRGIGPSLVGAVMVQATETKERRRDFWRRVVDPRRISLPWYLAVAAVSAGPTLLTKMRQGKSTANETPDQGQAIQILMGAPISGLSEELGWRGYALERLQERHSALGASLLLGAIWSLWHAPLFLIKGTYQHRLGIGSREAPLFFALEIPRAVLATWIYNNTRGSILSAVLLHAAENASMGITQGGRGVRLATLSGVSALVGMRWGPRTLSSRDRCGSARQ